MPPTSSPALSLEQLADEGGDPVLLVDFVQFTSTQQLADELSGYARGHRVLRIDPVTDLAREAGHRSLEALADGYAQLCRQHGLPGGRLAVVGYCSAAPLALELVDRLAPQAAVSTVLVQPLWPDGATVAAGFRSFRAELGAAPGPVPEPADPELALQQMTVVLRDDLRAMARAHGLDPASAVLGDMLARYRGWLGFLLAGSRAPRRAWPRGQVVEVPAGPLPAGALADRVLACAWSGDAGGG